MRTARLFGAVVAATVCGLVGGTAAASTGTTVSSTSDDTTGPSDDATWPRPYDPAVPLDLSGVPGVTPEQEQQATYLIATTQRDLPRFADVQTAIDNGFSSIGDSATGYEHFVNIANIVDDGFLDPTRPESLVYEVHGDHRTLVSAMFMAPPGTALDDPMLTDFAGPLMQWHIHDNLCWRGSQVAGVTDDDGSCPAGSEHRRIDIPMVHVWIAAHECGPFAALEGAGAGQTPGDDERADQCAAEHGGHGGHGNDETATTAGDDMSGMDMTSTTSGSHEHHGHG